MTPDLQRRVQRYGWDRAAPDYEPHWKAQLAPAQQQMLAWAQLQDFDQVLDVACGTGLVTFAAAQQVGPWGKVVATDLSDAMVDYVHAESYRQKRGQVLARQMDAEALEYPEASFDAVLCALGLMYLPDPLQALREMHRVVRPGGRVVAAVWGERAHCGWAEIFPIVDARVRTDVCPLFFQLGTGHTLRDEFRRAGFGQVWEKRMATTLHYESAEAACGAAFAGGPVALAYSRFDEPTRAATHAEYLDSIAPYRTGAAYAIPGEFVIVHGRRRRDKSEIGSTGRPQHSHIH